MTQNKLTIENILGMIENEDYCCFGTLTIAVLKLKNGAQVIGKSNCIDPINFDLAIGRKVARENAINAIWELEGYACKTRGFLPN